MIEEIKTDIEKRLNNINTLPKKNKEQRAKLSSYIDDNLAKYNEMLESVEKEMESRYTNITKCAKEDLEEYQSTMDYLYIKQLEKNVNSYFKMDLDYYFYQLDHYYKNDLELSNEIILKIIEIFNNVGIKLTEKDFNYSSYVNRYMKSLLNKEDMMEVFSNIYWQCSNIIILIVLNFKRIYYKNVKIIDKYYQKKDKTNEKIDDYLIKQATILNKYEKETHTNKNYILKCFRDKTYIINDYSKVNITKIKDNLLETEESISNLMSLKSSLEDYQNYLEYQYIFDDLKSLYNNKASYKGLFKTKLAAIIKKENKVIMVSKKMDKSSAARLEFNKLIDELIIDYKELDELLIKEDIVKYINDDNSWLDYVKIAINNFNYMTSIIKTTNDSMSLDEIINNIINIKNYVYNQKQNILDNVSVGGENNIPRMIVNRYKMTNININEDSITKDNIEALLNYVNILIINNDIKNVGLSYEDIAFVLNVEKIKNK